MFTLIRSWFSNDLLIELSQNLISIKVFGSKEKFEYQPFAALEDTPKGEVIQAIGKEAMSYTGNNVRVVNPFDHPRSFVADFLIAEKLIQHGVFEIHKARRFLRPSPRIVMHQLEKTEGGLTSVEDRVLRELAVVAGAREVLIHIGDKVPVDHTTFKEMKQRDESL